MGKTETDHILLTPGPVPFSSKVQDILSQPSLHHRDDNFKKIFKTMQFQLQYVFQTKNQVLVLNSSGTGAMEASITNTLSPGDEVICVCAGKFGERWREIARSYGLKIHSIDLNWGEAVSREKIENSLKTYPQAQALFITACETSTGTEHPIKEISSLFEGGSTLLIVDAITGVGSMDLKMDEMNIDVLVCGSQKSLGLPTGLSFISLSDRAWKKNASSLLPKYYFDLKKESISQKKHESAFSTNVPLVRALSYNLDLIQKRGMESFIDRTKTLAHTCQVFAHEMGLNLFSQKPSAAVTALLMKKDISAIQIKKSLLENHNVTIATGQNMFKDKMIRIGHLGSISNENFLKGLLALGKELCKIQPETSSSQQVKTSFEKAKKQLEAGTNQVL